MTLDLNCKIGIFYKESLPERPFSVYNSNGSSSLPVILKMLISSKSITLNHRFLMQRSKIKLLL